MDESHKYYIKIKNPALFNSYKLSVLISDSRI